MSFRPSDLPVIGLAHGSRHPGVRSALDELMGAVGDRCGAPARAAFLDLTEPDLETVTSSLAADGYEQAVVVPLLFTAAFHATIDVPQTVRTAGARARRIRYQRATAGSRDRSAARTRRDFAAVPLTGAAARFPHRRRGRTRLADGRPDRCRRRRRCRRPLRARSQQCGPRLAWARAPV